MYKKISASEVSSIKGEKLFHNKLKVKRIGKDVFSIIGFNYGAEEIKFTGLAEDVAKFLNGYLGLGQ